MERGWAIEDGERVGDEAILYSTRNQGAELDNEQNGHEMMHSIYSSPRQDELEDPMKSEGRPYEGHHCIHARQIG